MEKEDFRKLKDDIRDPLRKRAIAMIKKGVKKKEVASIMGVHANTVTNWAKSYEAKGSQGLKGLKRGVKSEDKKLLTQNEEQQIQEMICDVMPDQLKLPYALWTRKAVVELVEQELGVKLALTTMGDYLRSWGFTPQKPKKRAYEQNPKKVQKWLDEEYPAIKERAKQENAEIHWGDETGVKNNCQHGRSYAPKGKTPVKRSMSKRFSVNMISTVTNQGKVAFMIYTENMNADMFIKFLKQLIKDKERKIYLILDNLRVHHSKIVKAWEEENSEHIALYFLPSYSPEKNPDEYLNCDLKQGLSQKISPRTKEKLQDNLQEHMDMLQNDQIRVQRYFRHKDIRCAA
ncbi:MAG: IS630 family transposase [Reichenbachiella sp.]